MDPLWAVCSRCGAGHGIEEFARMPPASHAPFDIQSLPVGREENHVRTIWTAGCRCCGNRQFYIQLDPTEMTEFWEDAADEILSVEPGVDPAAHLAIWRERERQEQAEFREWQKRRRAERGVGRRPGGEGTEAPH